MNSCFEVDLTSLIKILMILVSFAALSSCVAHADTPPAPYGPVPSARQVEWYNREIIAFFHFGINTFGTEVNEGSGQASPDIFNPTALDCNQWMRVLKNAGIPCGILVAKHADGFCNWPTAYTDYSVKNSPWKGGKGDVVREYTDAAKAAGIKAGIYLGPYDRHETTYGTPAYTDHYASQLTELLSNYGPIWEIWWDGAGAGDLTTPMYARWAEIVHRLQPQCVIFGTRNSYPFADCRWVGNEAGHAGDPCWSTIDPDTIRVEDTAKLNAGELDGAMYSPAEADVSIRPSWFYHASEDGRVKSVSDLVDLYCNSVGRNSVLLLNFPPDRRGLIDDTDAANAAGLHHWIVTTFKHNLLKGAKISALHTRGKEYGPSNLVDDSDNTYFATTDDSPTDTITFDLRKPETFDCLRLKEVIQLGQRSTGWAVDYSTDGQNWTTISETSGKQCIGHEQIVRFAPITASHVRLRITSGRACVALNTFGVYKQP